jgi:hypothetical protein
LRESNKEKSKQRSLVLLKNKLREIRFITGVTTAAIIAAILIGCVQPEQSEQGASTCSVEAGFSPEGSAAALVQRTIESAH